MGNYLFHKSHEEMDPEKNNLTTMLNELKDAIGEGDKDEMKKIIDRFHQNLARNKKLLSEQYASGSQCATRTDLILTACRNKQADTLYYLLKETDILDHLPGASLDDPKEKKQRTEAFKHALRLDAFPMIEMLYDYWCGDLHWIGHDINKFTTLGMLLEDARVVCDVKEQQLLKDIHSLITFNAFQVKLYSTLCREVNSETKNLVKLLSIYDEYSDLENFRIPQEDKEEVRTLKADLKDKKSEYMKVLAYINYEVYFRKLDFNVALLILENLFMIKQRLRQLFNIPKEANLEGNQPAVQSSTDNVISLYKKIESALYHYIYRTNEDWRLYLPGNRRKTIDDNHTGIHKGRIINNLKITYDEHKLKHGSVLFLERKSFSKSLNELKKILEEHLINVDPAKEGQASKQKRKNVLDDNYLSPIMYMSDYYSLRKIVYYIKALKYTKDINVLMIERVLQVTGEMSKSTPESYHLLKSTRSLLQEAISEKTINNLRNIRNFLSKTDKGQLSTRIKIAVEHAHIFDDIKEDLKNIKQIINVILDLYKPIFDHSLLEQGLSLLEERVKNLPNKASRHFSDIYRRYELHGETLFSESGHLFQELRAYTDLTTPLLKEIICICYNRNDILTKIKSAKTTISEKAITFCLYHVEPPVATNLPIIENGMVTIILAELATKKITRKYSFVGIEKLNAIYKEDTCVQEQAIKREKLISCLISRVNLLKKTLQYPQYILQEGDKPSNQLLQRYKHDQEFRFVLEMILADIANVLDECKLKVLMKKNTKLLRDINLGNVLDHGDPFLEVIGDVFDSNDLSTGLLLKAIMFAKDGESIEALFELIRDNVDYETIENEKLENMNDGQKQLYKQFQMSPNWKSYVKFVPNAPARNSKNYCK